MLTGTELRPVSLNKRKQKDEALLQKHLWRVHVSPMFPQFPTRETLLPVSVLVFKIQIMLNLHGREF